MKTNTAIRPESSGRIDRIRCSGGIGFSGRPAATTDNTYQGDIGMTNTISATDSEVVNQPAIDRYVRRLAQLRSQLAKAERHLASLPRPSETRQDQAIVNVPGRLGNLDRDIERGVAINKAASEVERLSYALGRAEGAPPKPLTLEDIKGARAIHDGTRWFPVRKVNRKTVTTPEDVKIPFERITAVLS